MSRWFGNPYLAPAWKAWGESSFEMRRVGAAPSSTFRWNIIRRLGHWARHLQNFLGRSRINKLTRICVTSSSLWKPGKWQLCRDSLLDAEDKQTQHSPRPMEGESYESSLLERHYKCRRGGGS